MITRPPALSPDLAHVSDDELALLRAAAPQRLAALATAEEVRAVYRDEITPLEREAAWRSSRGREPFDLLFITVGAQSDTPIAVGLAWPAHHVVLVHTDGSRRHAKVAAKKLGLTLATGGLCDVGSGTDAVLIYRKVYDTYRERGRPARVAIDPTGGFKVMSAAAAAVGFALPGTTILYVETSQPRFRDQICWLDTRAIVLDNPYTVFGDVERSAARRLLEAGNWEAAAEAWRSLAARTRFPRDDWRASLARALAAREALDFRAATEQLAALVDDVETRCRTQPDLRDDPLALAVADLRALLEGTAAVRDVVAQASWKGADAIIQQGLLSQPGYLDLVAFLIELARVRLAAGQHDLASLYAYRAMEAMPARRLHLRGFDPDAMDWARYKQDRGLADLSPLGLTDEDARPEAARGVALAALAVGWPDDLVPPADLDRLKGVGQARNKSILAHGVAQVDKRETERLLATTESLFARLLALEDPPVDAARLRARHVVSPALLR